MTDQNDTPVDENRWDKVESIPVKQPLWNPFTLLVTCVVLAICAGLFFQMVAVPYLETRTAQGKLDNLSTQRGDLIAMNTDVVTFQGQQIESATINQKALSNDGVQAPGAAFIFGNNKPGEKKVVEVFIDFKSQRSRDFMLINHDSLKGMIENGLIELHVLPIPTGNAYNVYASEALAETFAAQPSKAWKLMYELLRQGSAVDTDEANSVAERVAGIAKVLTDTDTVTVESIQAGTFSGWLIAGSKDQRLLTSFSPPLIFADGKLIDSNEININNPDSFRDAVVSQ